MKTIIAPSLLAADWARVSEEVLQAEVAGAEWLHLDIMDGRFVPPITFGYGMVATCKKHTKLFLDVHLMIVEPEKHLENFAHAGADCITVHQEACPHLHRTIQRIHELGCKAGVAINPATSIAQLESVKEIADLFLIMTVNPGWGGQKFIEGSPERIRQARSLIDKSGRDIYLEVDGGITEETAKIAKSSGAQVLVAGTSIFGSKDYKKAISSLRN